MDDEVDVRGCVDRGRKERRDERGLWPLAAACLCLALGGVGLQACARADIPGTRQVNIPTPAAASERREGVNEQPDPVLYLPLGRDVLVPEVAAGDPLPSEEVGPFELRSETVAGALQLILADYQVPLAFQEDAGLDKRITVANLRGTMGKVVEHVCGLADLYCSYEDGILVVKKTQTFTVKVPPISQDTSFTANVAKGLSAVIGTGGKTTIDDSTHTIIYETTQRNAEMAERYFQRMRTSTALIVFETYIWEVTLNSGNSAGISWNMLKSIGKFQASISETGSIGADFTNPISIGLPTTKGADGAISGGDLFKFLSTYGAVKTISQPQITVLSGSKAKLRAADKTNYVSRISETIDNGQATTSVDTSSVDTGFTLTIGGAWDNSTVYANIQVLLTNVAKIDNFDFSSGAGGAKTTIQLPHTTERELDTQVRIRPGDSLLIAGLVREGDEVDKAGPGLTTPILPTSRTTSTQNMELVFLLRPRVVVFTSPEEGDRYGGYRGTAVAQSAAFDFKAEPEFNYTFEPFKTDTDIPDFGGVSDFPGLSSSPSSQGGTEVLPMGSVSSESLNPDGPGGGPGGGMEGSL